MIIPSRIRTSMPLKPSLNISLYIYKLTFILWLTFQSQGLDKVVEKTCKELTEELTDNIFEKYCKSHSCLIR